MAQRMTREERRQKMALEEARKAGDAPPEVDNEGNLINPHIPEFMSKAPWYLNQEEGAGLKHQKLADDRKAKSAPLDQWYRRGKDVLLQGGTTKRRFQKGSCKNCGATTHDAKQCMERPRKVGAWKTNKDLAPDEIVQERLELSYDASRDRWNGYDTNEHVKTAKLFQRAEEEKRKQVLRERDERLVKKAQRNAEKLRAKQAAAAARQGQDGEGAAGCAEDSDSGSDSASTSDSEQEDILGVKQDDAAEPSFAVGSKVKATVRSLRIREDTAKYLHNLDVDSAFYEPKTRSMRDNPNPNLDPSEANYAGDNYVRVSGDAVEMAKAQVFAWEAERRGETEGHLQANPTQVSLAKRQFEERARKLRELRAKEMHDRYGGEEHTKARPPSALLVGESSAYAEYTADGRLVRGGAKAAQMNQGAGVAPAVEAVEIARTAAQAKSQYAEDVAEGNHKAVWGSYFDRANMAWGFACCYQTSRKSYCTGAAGRAAKIESQNVDLMRARVPGTQDERAPPASSSSSTTTTTFTSHTAASAADLYGEGNVKASLDSARVQAAVLQLDARTNNDRPATETPKRRKKEKHRNKHKRRKRSRSRSGSTSSSSSSRGSAAVQAAKSAPAAPGGADVTPEEMEAYRLTKAISSDPMHNVQRDELLPRK